MGNFGVIRDLAYNLKYIATFLARGAHMNSAAQVRVSLEASSPTLSANISQIAAGTAINGGVTGSLAIGGPVAGGSGSAAQPLPLGGVDFNTTAANKRAVNALFTPFSSGAGASYGEMLTAGSSEIISDFSLLYNATYADGTVGKVITVPNKESEVYLYFSSISTSPTCQLEGSFDGVNYSVIPVFKIEPTTTVVALTTAWTPAVGSIYKCKNYSYPLLRLRATAGTTTNLMGLIRVIPSTDVVPGQIVSPFSLSAANTTEAVGSSAGALQSGGIRTLAVNPRGAAKAIVYFDQMAWAGTMATTNLIAVLEGNTDPNAAAGATTWATLPMSPYGGGAAVTSFTSAFATVATIGTAAGAQPPAGIFESDVSQFAQVRVRLTTLGGTATAQYIHGALKIVPSASAQSVISGPGEQVYQVLGFTAGSATPADGTNSKTFNAPAGVNADLYFNCIAQGNGSNTIQIEGTFDNITFNVIPLSRVDNFTTSQQYAFLGAFTPVSGAVYKGNTYGYNLIRVHQTAFTTAGTSGTLRIVPLNTGVPGSFVVSPFSLSAANTTEAAGSANGALMTGGVRTLSSTVKGSAKALLQMDAMTWTGTMSAGIQMVLEGNTNPAAGTADATWQALTMYPQAGGPGIASYTGPATVFALPIAGTWEADVSKMALVRVRMSNVGTGGTVPYIHGVLKVISAAGAVKAPATFESYFSCSPTIAATIAGTIEASATKTIRIKRVTVLNPGAMTGAQKTFLNLIRTTTAGTSLTISNTVASGNALTTSATHYLSVGQPVSLASITGISGLTAGVVYFVQSVPSATTLTFAATPGGAVLTVNGTPSTTPALTSYAAPRDGSGPTFTGTVRTPGATAGTLGNSVASISVFTPTTLAAYTPVLFDLTDTNQLDSAFIPSGTTNGIAFVVGGATGGVNFDFKVAYTEE